MLPDDVQELIRYLDYALDEGWAGDNPHQYIIPWTVVDELKQKLDAVQKGERLDDSV